MKLTPIIVRISARISLCVATLMAVATLCTTDLQATDKKPTFKKASEDLITKVRAMIGKDRNGAIKEYAKGARLLANEYPDEVGPRAMLLEAANMLNDPKQQKAILAELSLLKDEKFAEIAKRAKGQLKKLEALGRPIAISFVSIDSRRIDLSAFKGKVVLLDFWATWCGPCVREVPNIKRVYDKYHRRGFEIIGVSLDSNLSKLQSFILKNRMPWPQYWDGLGWNNHFAKKYGINSIPAMWLIERESCRF